MNRGGIDPSALRVGAIFPGTRGARITNITHNSDGTTTVMTSQGDPERKLEALVRRALNAPKRVKHIITARAAKGVSSKPHRFATLRVVRWIQQETLVMGTSAGVATAKLVETTYMLGGNRAVSAWVTERAKALEPKMTPEERVKHAYPVSSHSRG